MAIESKEKIVDGKTVKVTQLPATYANQLFTRVLKYFGSGIVQLLGLIKSISSVPEVKDGKVSLLDLDLDWKAVAGIISDFSAKLTPEEWQEFCLKLLAYTDVNEKRITDETAFNAVFTGKLLFMCKVLVFTLEVNYGDFFEAGGIGSQPMPSTAKKSK